MSWLFAPLYDFAMRSTEEACLTDWRQEVLSVAVGSVIEIGAGTGANLPLYPPAVRQVTLVEPDPGMRRQLARKVRGADDPRLVISDASAQCLPFDDGSFDTAVSTLVLCTVPDPEGALREIHRVLRPGGALLYLEHVHADSDPGRARWQRRWNPLWRRLMGGCELTRQTGETIQSAGFHLETCVPESMRKALPIVRPTIRGVARRPGAG